MSKSVLPPVGSAFVRPQSRREWILTELRKDLISGQLAPGSSIRQEDLANKYGVSQAPVREAFKSLVAEGLLTYTPNREHRVPAPGWDDLQELNAVLGLLEKEALSRNTVGDAGASGLAPLETLKGSPRLVEISSCAVVAAESLAFRTPTFSTLQSFLERYSNQRRQAFSALFPSPLLVERDALVDLLEAMLSGDVGTAEEKRLAYRSSGDFSRLQMPEERA
jgi:DNA-binding transcriptional MocR family regulator